MKKYINKHNILPVEAPALFVNSSIGIVSDTSTVNSERQRDAPMGIMY